MRTRRQVAHIHWATAGNTTRRHPGARAYDGRSRCTGRECPRGTRPPRVAGCALRLTVCRFSLIQASAVAVAAVVAPVTAVVAAAVVAVAVVLAPAADVVVAAVPAVLAAVAVA